MAEAAYVAVRKALAKSPYGIYYVFPKTMRPPYKFYVAGKWSDMKLIGEYIHTLTEMGHECTHDWTAVEQMTRTSETLGSYAERDIEGVKKADVVIFMFTDTSYAYRGTFTELGCALALDKKIIAISTDVTISDDSTPDEPCFKTNCFYHHPSINHVATWEDAMKAFIRKSPK